MSTLNPIDLSKLENTPVYEVVREYLEMNTVSIQNMDALENYFNIINRLKECFEEADFKTAGPLIRLGHVMLRIESEKLLLKYMDDDAREKYISGRSKWYRLEIETEVQKILMGLISRNKNTILIDQKEDDGHSLIGIGDLNRRRDTTDEDLRSILDDDEKFEEIRIIRETSENERRELLSNTVVEDFDMDTIMNRFTDEMTGKEKIFLYDMDMDYLDAFMAGLHLSNMGRVELIQNEIYDPIMVIPMNEVSD